AAQLPVIAICELTLRDLREWIADRNPDAQRFPSQTSECLPLSARFAGRHGLHPYAIPSLSDLIAFIEAYAGGDGSDAGKTAVQRANAARVVLDLEVKRAPFVETLADAQATEEALLATVGAAAWVGRCRVRSFDHRVVWRLLHAELGLTGGVLVTG